MHRDIFYCRSCCSDVWMKTSVPKNSILASFDCLSVVLVLVYRSKIRAIEKYYITYGFVFLQTFYFLIICFVGYFIFWLCCYILVAHFWLGSSQYKVLFSYLFDVSLLSSLSFPFQWYMMLLLLGCWYINYYYWSLH